VDKPSEMMAFFVFEFCRVLCYNIETMPTQSDRQNYQWRPNDNSVQTNLRYDLEAEHWTRAFKSAQMKQR